MTDDLPYVDKAFDRCVEQFESLWRSSVVPAIGEFLTREDLDEAQLHELLAELVMIDLEYRWRVAAQVAVGDAESTLSRKNGEGEAPQRLHLEDYVERFPELGQLEQLSLELIASEYRVRHRWGDQPCHEEYFQRFPRRERAVSQALNSVDAHLPQPSESADLRIRCPHCHVSIEFGDRDLGGKLTCPSCNQDFSLVGEDQGLRRLAAGERLGSFELLRKVGSGSFGTVWKARDKQLDRVVAIKLPHQGLLEATQREQFLREARTAAQLNHPHIVPVYEIGREDERLFIVTELVQGDDLAHWLSRERPTPREAAELCIAIADALEHAHQCGIVHRDLKPSNIMLDADGEPRLTDFGLAKGAAGEVTLTVEGKLLGSPAYMSPEQARGSAHKADRRTDIYSLGVILFELLTGERPFGGSTSVLLERIVSEDPISPCRLSGSMPRDLETICLKCLEKDPQQRYQTAAQLREDLRRFLQGAPVLARPITKVDRVWRWCKRNSAVAALGVTAASLLLILGVAGPLVAFREVAAREEMRKKLYISDMNAAVQAWEAADVRRVRELLDRHRPHGNQQDLRRFEWFYFWHLCQRSASAKLLPHQLPLLLVAYSPDGKTFASASGQVGNRFEVTLWDVGTSRSIKSLELNDRNICAGAFSPDLQTIALGYSDGTIRLTSILGTDPETTISEHTEQILSLAFTSNGVTLASRSQHKVALTNRDTFTTEWSLATNEGPPNAPPTWFSPMAFSPDGRTLAWGTTDGKIKLYDTETKTELAVLEGHVRTITSLAFSPNGDVLASTGMWGTYLFLWDVTSHQLLHRLEGHRRFVLSASFSADGSVLASAAADNTVRLWDVSTGKQSQVLRGHEGGVTSVAFSPTTDTLASGGEGCTVRLWNIARNTEQDLLKGHRDGVWDLAFSPDSRTLASASRDGTIKLWDIATGKIQRTLQGHAEQFWCVAYSPYGEIVASGSSVLNTERRTAKVRLWNAATGEVLRESSLAAATVRSVAYVPDGKRIALGTANGEVFVQDAVTSKLSKMLGRHADSVYSVALSPDGSILASGGRDNLVKLWDAKSGRHLRDLRGHMGLVMSVAFSPDGNILGSASRDRTVKLWDVRDGRQTATLTGHAGWVMCVDFSPNGHTLVSGDSFGMIKLWDVDTQQLRVNLHAKTGLHRARFSPDGQILATSAGGSVQLWRATTDGMDEVTDE